MHLDGWIHCRNIGLSDNLGSVMAVDKKLHIHIHENKQAINIGQRREKIKEVRRIYSDTKFHFGELLDFVQQVFPVK